MSRFFAFLILLSLFLPLGAFQVDSVEVVGNHRTEGSIVTQYFDEKRDYSEKEIDEILAKIIDVKVFEDISVYYDDVKKALIFKVLEYPIIKSVRFSGNKKIDKDDINEVLTLKKNELLDNHKIAKNVENIVRLYHDKGFLMVLVDPEIVTDEKKREVSIDFKIVEGGKSRVKKIVITGNEHIDENTIKEFLTTQEDGLFSFAKDGGYKKSDLEEDVAKITYLYNEEGFVNVKVAPPTVTVSPDKRDLYITYVVEEGLRYRKGKFTISGDTLDSGEMPQKKFRQKSGEWYKHSLVIRDFEDIK
ncbi:hypothetical protein J5834_05735, partial [bacterium]|nr:hypothetical protein [bacterium]